MNSDELKYKLVRGLDIDYNNLTIKQPLIADIDKVGIEFYSSMVYVFCIEKEHLQLWDTLKNEFNGKSLFQSLFIQEKYYLENDGEIKSQNSIIALLANSLVFFLGINIEDIEVLDDEKIIINYKKELFGKVFSIPFELNNDNFEEFSELIRTITWNEKYKIKKEDEKRVTYADPSVQKIYEDLLKDYEKGKEEKEQESNITISDIIGAICVNENTKYNYKNINELTVWQLFYLFKSMFEKENINITKMQYTSGNFVFDKPPDLDWLKKIKISSYKINK